MSRTLVLLALAATAGCGTRLVDPCAGVSGTCLALQVLPSPGVTEVDTLAYAISGNGIADSDTIQDDNRSLRLPLGIGLHLNQLADADEYLRVEVKGTRAGRAMSAQRAVVVSPGAHVTLELRLAAEMGDAGTGGGGGTPSLLQFDGPPWVVSQIAPGHFSGIVGRPYAVAIDGSTVIFARAPDGSLLRISGPPWQAQNLSSADAVGGVKIAGDPVYAIGGTVGTVYARGTDGALLRFSGEPWSVTNVSSAVGDVKIVGQPAVAQSGASPQIFARGVDGSLLSFTASPWHVTNISQAIGDVRLGSDPTVRQGSPNLRLFAAGTDQSVLLITGPPWQIVNVSSLAGGDDAKIQGNVVAIGGVGGALEGFYARGRDGALLQFSENPWQVWNISTMVSSLTLIAGDPVVRIEPGSVAHVYARGNSGELLEFVGSPWFVNDLSYSGSVQGVLLGGDPFLFGTTVFAASGAISDR